MANPRKIKIDISKEDTELCSFSVDVKDNTLESLIQSLQEAKEVSNKHLTDLVNEQKSQQNSICRKIEEVVSSDENIEESTSKKLKTDIGNVNTEENSD